MKIYLLGPNFCWHTKDLIELSNFCSELNFIFLADTPPFLTREFFKKKFYFLNLSYEFFQRIWRLTFCIPWSIYIRSKVYKNNDLIYCHGLFALFIAHIGGIKNSRLVFTPQGSDLLVLPDKNIFVRNFLNKKLPKISYLIADSDLLLNKALNLAPKINISKIALIQNGISFDDIEKLSSPGSHKKKRQIDICWVRGFSKNYQFDYFLKILESLSSLSNSKINISIVAAFGSSIIPKKIFSYPNINVSLLPRLSKSEFLKCLYDSKMVLSIPISDSSPRSVYESIALGCQLFATNLSCFDWIPDEMKSRFIFATYNVDIDSKKILNNLDNFKELQNFYKTKDNFPYFFESLNYNNIAKSYLKIFKKIKHV